MAAAAGKARPQFPLLVEEGQAPLFESDAIVKTLFEKYGGSEGSPSSSAPIPWQLRPGSFFAKVSLGLSAAPRAGKGHAAAFQFADDEAGKKAAEAFAAGRRGMKPLVLWGYEPSPYVTLVREKLTELVSSLLVVVEMGKVFFSLARAPREREISSSLILSFSLSLPLFLSRDQIPTTGAPAPLRAGPAPRREEAIGAVREMGADQGPGEVSSPFRRG